jgi:peptide/nickel transport system permease protein
MRAARYLLRRTARAMLTLLLMIAITFAFYFAIERQPPLGFMFPDVAKGSTPTPQQIAMANHVYYLDRSKIGLYFQYLGNLAHGDFGQVSTIQNGKLVDGFPIRAPYPQLRATLSILIGGAVLVVLLALPLGAISGSRIGSWADRVISFGALVLVCFHPMMLGLILRNAGGRIHGLPTSGYCTFGKHVLPPDQTRFFAPGSSFPCSGGPTQWFTHLLLPWLTFALLFLALYTRMVRASVAETIHEDFVRTARAKGASQTRLLARHVLPNAGLRVLTMVGMEIGTAIGVCIYIESAFGINGLGTAAVQELGGGGFSLVLPSMLAIVVLITLIVVVGNLVVDALYAVLDPRVGLQQGEQRTKSLVGGVF